MIYYRHSKNRGASSARNTGIRNSKGEYFAFLDDDDEWFPEKLEKQVNLLNTSRHEVGLVYCWMCYVKNDIVLTNYTPRLKGYIFKDMLDKQGIGNSSTLLVKRKVIDRVGFFDESLLRGNDGDFIRRVSRVFYIDFVHEVLVKVHANHGLPRISDDTIPSVNNVIKSLKIRFEKFPDDIEEYPKEFASICLFIAYNYVKIRKFKSSLFWSLKAIAFAPLSVFVYKRIINLFMEAFSYSIK